MAHLFCSGHFLLELGQRLVVLWGPPDFSLQLACLVLGLFVIHSLVLPFLDGLSQGADTFAGVGGGRNDARIDESDLFEQVRPQFGVGLFQLEGALEL